MQPDLEHQKWPAIPEEKRSSCPKTQLGTCLCYGNIRHGFGWSNGLILGSALLHFCFVMFILFHNVVLYIYFIRDEVVSVWAVVCWIASAVTGIVGFFLRGSRDRGTQQTLMKAWLILMFGVLVCWLAYGIDTTITLRRWHENMLLGKHVIDLAEKNDGKVIPSWIGKVAASVTAVVANPLMADALLSTLPFPLNFLFWLGWHFYMPVILLIFIPLVVNVTCFYYGLSYLAILEEGGDGNERVASKMILWFYDLPAEAQDAIRCGVLSAEEAGYDPSYYSKEVYAHQRNWNEDAAGEATEPLISGEAAYSAEAYDGEAYGTA